LGAVTDLPVLALAFAMAALACGQWTRLALCARISLAGATVFAIVAIRYPGEGMSQMLGHTDDGLAYLAAVAGGACAAVVMITAVALMRGLQSR
jgi:hypothetical protein